MSNGYFQFRQFLIRHDRCAMKVGTDGVLLGAWTEVGKAAKILDVGTGTGLIALMLAQRTSAPVHITGIEIDDAAYVQASENIAVSPWKDRVEVLHEDFRTFDTGERFDLIVSNPPYFVNSLKCPDRTRATARHTDSLSFENLFRHSAELLVPEGRLEIIFPTQAWEDIRRSARWNGMTPFRGTEVYTTPQATSKRMLAGFRKKTCSTDSSGFITDRLYIENGEHGYTPEFQRLIRDFYLHV